MGGKSDTPCGGSLWRYVKRGRTSESGIDLFIERDIPFLKKYDTKIIVNVCGKTTEDYLEVVERLADQPVDMLEINISARM